MKAGLIVAVVLAVAAGAFWAGSRFGQHATPSGGHVGMRNVLYYVDPMNPSHTSDKPGLAPCGMKMEPVYGDLSLGSAPAKGPTLMLPGTVIISSEKQQLIGVQLAVAEKRSLKHTLRLLGKVAIDETRTYRINATVDGWITRAMPVAAGSQVKKNETLAGFYSPEFLAAGQALLFALGAADRVPVTGNETEAQRSQMANFDLNLKQYRDGLKNLGMGDLQIDELVHTRKFMEDVNIDSPAAAFIQSRNVSPGQRFDKGTELFRLADLSRVWILTDVFERDARLVENGKLVRVTVPGRKEVFAATVSETLPQFDNVTRTLKLRLEADNPGFALKPDMFVDVEFAVNLPETLVVPADAVLDAGLRKTIFVDRGNGCFEPRPVETGWRLGESVEIVRGLMPSERIVVSGNFLLDSESRVKLAVAGVHGTPSTDPVCGMAVDEPKARAASLTSQYAGATVFFCGDGCKKQFDAEPGRYLNQPVAAAATQAATANQTASPGAPKAQELPVPVKTVPTDSTERRSKDPVCNMQVAAEEARSAGRFSLHEGRETFFCSDVCKQRFDKNPTQFLMKLEDHASSRAPAAANPTAPPPHRDQPHH